MITNDPIEQRLRRRCEIRQQRQQKSSRSESRSGTICVDFALGPRQTLRLFVLGLLVFGLVLIRKGAKTFERQHYDGVIRAQNTLIPCKIPHIVRPGCNYTFGAQVDLHPSVPVVLYGERSVVDVWLTTNGNDSFTRPGPVLFWPAISNSLELRIHLVGPNGKKFRTDAFACNSSESYIAYGIEDNWGGGSLPGVFFNETKEGDGHMWARFEGCEALRPRRYHLKLEQEMRKLRGQPPNPEPTPWFSLFSEFKGEEDSDEVDPLVSPSDEDVMSPVWMHTPSYSTVEDVEYTTYNDDVDQETGQIEEEEEEAVAAHGNAYNLTPLYDNTSLTIDVMI